MVSSPQEPQTLLPRTVTAVLCLIAAQTVLAGLGYALRVAFWTSLTASIVGLIFLGIYLLWLYGMWRRLNWLRLTTIVLGVGGCLLAPRSLARIHDPTQLALYWVQFAITVATVGLLLMPSARAWYQQRTVP